MRFFLVLFLCLPYHSICQFGAHFVAGYPMGKLISTGITGDFGSGFELGFGCNSKMTDKYEFRFNVSYYGINTKNNIGYGLTNEYENSKFYKVNFDETLSVLSTDFLFTYNFYKNILGVTGGISSQFNFSPPPEFNDITIYVSKENIDGKLYSQEKNYLQMPDAKPVTFSPSVGLTYSPFEKLQIFSLMQIPLTGLYKTEDSQAINPIFNIVFRTGVVINIVASDKKRRF